MRDYQAFRHTAIRYWERRRIIYNLALLLPAFLGYRIADDWNYGEDPHRTHYAFIFPWFVLSVLGANLCYSFAYALEFLFGSDDPTSRWLRFGRSTAFLLGFLLAMCLAVVIGWNIAMMAFYEHR